LNRDNCTCFGECESLNPIPILMREVCFLLVQDKILRAYFGTAARIPDSRERWEMIWAHRDEITEIAHTHPGDFLGFSDEDLTTMEAVEAGTGKRFAWSVVTRRGFLSRKDGKDLLREDDRWWVGLLRELSFRPSPRTRQSIKRERSN
jgi:hypothetical protein